MTLTLRRRPTSIAAAFFALALPILSAAYDAPRPVPHNLIVEGSLPEATRHRNQTLQSKRPPVLLTLAGGHLQKGIAIEPGSGRRLAFSATNAEGKEIYQGELELDVDSRFVPQVSVEFKSVVDGAAATLTLASHRVSLETAGVEREGALYTRITGDVFDADGRRLPLEEGELAFDVHGPGLDLLPCPGPHGGTVCTEFLPPRSPLEVQFGVCFRDRICKFEYVPPVTPVWRKVSLGMGWHACALKLNGELYCWGQGEHGQLGYAAQKLCSPGGSAGATHGCSGMPQQVTCSGAPCLFTDVSVGTRHTCAVDFNQDAWCWGDNFDGQLGLNFFDRTHEGSPEPRRVVGGLKFLSIHAGFNQTCGLTVTHQVFCWGDNSNAIIPTLADGWANDPRVVNASVVFDTLDFSYTHACGQTSGGDLHCWGINVAQVLGAGGFSPAPACASCPGAPLLMQGRIAALANQPVSLVSAGAHGSCAHLANGDTPCWGWALPAFDARPLDRLARGFHHACAISRGDMFCLGSSALGDGSDWHEVPGVGPVRVGSPPAHFREMDTGYGATCGIGSDENVYCWGSTSYAQLGLGLPAGYVTKPTPLSFPTTLKFPVKLFPAFTRKP
jgi:alpha-tubulin suppressor-like RCC1 family protein